MSTKHPTGSCALQFGWTPSTQWPGYLSPRTLRTYQSPKARLSHAANLFVVFHLLVVFHSLDPSVGSNKLGGYPGTGVASVVPLMAALLPAALLLVVPSLIREASWKPMRAARVSARQLQPFPRHRWPPFVPHDCLQLRYPLLLYIISVKFSIALRFKRSRYYRALYRSQDLGTNW